MLVQGYIGPGLGVATIAIIGIVCLIILISLFVIVLTPIKRFLRKFRK